MGLSESRSLVCRFLLLGKLLQKDLIRCTFGTGLCVEKLLVKEGSHAAGAPIGQSAQPLGLGIHIGSAFLSDAPQPFYAPFHIALFHQVLAFVREIVAPCLFVPGSARYIVLVVSVPVAVVLNVLQHLFPLGSAVKLDQGIEEYQPFLFLLIHQHGAFHSFSTHPTVKLKAMSLPTGS